MKICLKRRVWILPVVALLALGACTSVDDLLGNELIPENQQMQVYSATFGEDGTDPVWIQTRLTNKDTIATCRTGYIFLGSRFTQGFGYSTASGLVQPIPGGAPTNTTTAEEGKGDYFGYKAKGDSLSLYLTVADFGGNTDTEQTFNVYEMTETVDRYQYAKYKNPVLDGYYDASKPLFSFKHSGTGSIGKIIKYEDMTDAGRDYIDRLVTTGLNYTSDSIFVFGNTDSSFAGFKGLAIVADATRADAGQYCIYLDHNQTYTGLTLYTHHYEADGSTIATTTDDDGTTTTDVIAMSYVLSDNLYSATSEYFSPSSLFSVQHDYSTESFNADINQDVQVETAYVEGLNGVYTQLYFTDELLAAIRALAAGKNIAINNATLLFKVADETPAAMNGSLSRLGMFLDYSKMTTGYIPDYDYYNYEGYYGTGTLPYGGYMNRGSGQYSMNITSTVQQMLKKSDFQRSISLTPDVTEAFGFGQTSLLGSASPGYRIKLKLTYTLIP